MSIFSTILKKIERNLFPDLQEDLGPLSDSMKKLVAILEIIRIEDFVLTPRRGYKGRPPEDYRPIARAYVAKALLNLPTTEDLIETLKNNTNLRLICGFNTRSDIASPASFSRAFTCFALTALPAKVHAAILEKYEKDHLVGHISRDSTAIEAREKPAKKAQKEEAPKKRKRGRPKKGEIVAPKEPTRLQKQAAGMTLDEMIKDLPSACDVGSKKNSKGYIETWRGYKLHIDWADGGIPISCILTSASVHDSQVAIPLALMSVKRVDSCYDLMDSAYDAPEIKEICAKLNHVAIIDQNPRRGERLEMEPARAQRYKERSTAERGNSQLKDNFGGRMLRVKGAHKVYAHLMFGILALTVDQLIRLVI